MLLNNHQCLTAVRLSCYTRRLRRSVAAWCVFCFHFDVAEFVSNFLGLYVHCVSKNGARVLCLISLTMWTNFNNSFTFAFSDELQKNHLTSNLLMHYLAKVECSTLQLFSMLFVVYIYVDVIYIMYLC